MHKESKKNIKSKIGYIMMHLKGIKSIAKGMYMKNLLYIWLLTSCLTLCGMNSTENRQMLVDSELVSSVRREMRSLFIYGFLQDCPYSKEAYNIINLMASDDQVCVGISPEAFELLHHRGFLDENNQFYKERLEAWRFLKPIKGIEEE